MKHKHWDEYTDARKLKECKKEAATEKNSGSTRADLIQMIKFMDQILDPYIAEDLEDEWKMEVE